VTPMMVLGHVFSGLYGLVLGSFWNVAIARLPEGRSLWPRSRCPHCDAPVAARDNVPVLSWLLLRGRCRSCSSPISPRYPLIELLGSLLGVLLFRSLVPDASFLDPAHLVAWVVQFTFLSLLVIGAYVDLRHRILPDEVTLFAAPLGFLGALATEWIGYDGWMAVHWKQAVLGALVWPSVFGLGAFIGALWMGREILGRGDVKLMAMYGAFLGPLGTLVAVTWGSIIGSVVGIVYLLWKRRRPALPFGPPLAMGAVLLLFYGKPFVDLMFPNLRL
jgi:leader peptidase (prepilin peptidase)/N-methyltransferase